MTKNCLGGLTIIVLLFISSMSEGADWVKAAVSEDSEVVFSVDVSNIKKTESNLYNAWYKLENSKMESIRDKEITLIKTHALFDCEEKRIKDLQSAYYTLDNYAYSTGEKDWEYTVPESNWGGVLNFVCNYKKDVLSIPKREGNQDK